MTRGERVRTIRRLAGLAAVTAPKVRRMAADEELRGDVGDVVRATRDLVRDLAADEMVRGDVGDLVAAAVDSASRARADVTSRRQVRILPIVAGGGLLLLAGAALIAALAYPRSRRTIVHAAGETRQRATTTVHDARERFGRGGGNPEQQAA